MRKILSSDKKTASPDPIWKCLWFHTCSWFTVLTLALLSVQYLIPENDTTFLMIPYRYLLLFPFALLMGGLTLLPRLGVRRPLYLLCHFAGFLAGFFLCLILPAASLRASTRLLLVLALALFYWLVRLAFAGIRKLKNAKEPSESSYQNLYK